MFSFCHATLSPQKYLTQIPENEKTPAYPACTHFPHQKFLFSLETLSREACRKIDSGTQLVPPLLPACSRPSGIFRLHFLPLFTRYSYQELKTGQGPLLCLKIPLLSHWWEFLVQHGLRLSNIPMVWPPAASLSSLPPSSLQTCTTYIFLLAKERWMSLSVTVYQQCWHLMS